MNTPSPARMGLGVTLMVRPRLCLGAALTPLATTTATSVVTTVASTARRKRMSAPFRAWCGVVPPLGSRLPTMRWRLDAGENTPPERKLRSALDFSRGGLVYPRGGRWPRAPGAGVLADRALLPRLRTGAAGAAIGSRVDRATRGARGGGPRPDAERAQRPQACPGRAGGHGRGVRGASLARAQGPELTARRRWRAA